MHKIKWLKFLLPALVAVLAIEFFVLSLGAYADYFAGQTGYSSISSTATLNSDLIIGTSTTTNSYLSISVSAVVTTNGASGINPSYATLQGTLLTLGGSTYAMCSFQYGTTVSYGSTTVEQNLTSPQGFTQLITGLTYNTTYYFRAVARFGTYYFYGANQQFTTSPVAGSTTDIRIIDAKIFNNYITSGDLLLVAETMNNYSHLYPDANPKEHFTLQLLGTDHSTILAASPIANWGDRPSSIYLNPTVVATNITQGSAYWVRMIGDSLSGNAFVDYQLVPVTSSNYTDWKGSDLTKLDSWCIGTAVNMGLSDGGTINKYITYPTDRGAIINDDAGGYFTTGIPAIGQIRPRLFTTTQYKTPIAGGTPTNIWDSPTAWQTFVGATIAGDVTTIAIPFGITGKDLLAGVIMLAMLGCVMTVVGGTGGFGALGAILIAVPILWLGTYFRIVTIALITILVIFFGIFAIRQFVIKTL